MSVRYTWLCDCGHETIVSRKMSDIDVPPDNGCEQCQSKDLKRIISLGDKKNVKGFILVEGGTAKWHNEGYSKTRSID